ncbi:MAG: ComEA family DNA-binding protein [Nannocystaceae bacterium]|nr:helix-hairpin-helix domain-containing protein [bacterium]
MPRAASGGRGPWLLAALGCLVTLWGLRGPPRRPVDAPSCEHAVFVDGALVCGQARRVVDACGQAHVLRSGDVIERAACESPRRMSPADLAGLAVRLNPNRDDAAALQSLPGVGPVLAARIVEGRPHADAAALLKVKGIGPRTLARIRPRLTFEDPPP